MKGTCGRRSRASSRAARRTGWATDSDPFLAGIRSVAPEIQALYEGREFGKALRAIMEQADVINAYVDANKPWVLAKDSANDAALQEVCSRLLESFRLLTLYLKPVLPQVAPELPALHLWHPGTRVG